MNSQKIITCKASTLDFVTLLIMPTATVKRPADEDASRRAPSCERATQLCKHCRHSCSSNRALLAMAGGIRVFCVDWLSWTALRISSNRVTPSKGSPTNSCTKLK